MASTYLYGLHDPGGEHLMEQAGKPGWLVFTEAIGSDPQDRSGRDYRQWSSRGFSVIVRLNNGYGSGGTIPQPALYGDFARRCANFVAASRGCTRWIIGNEPNHQQEWPNGQVIQSGHYVDCFQRCRQLIKAVQAQAEVLLAGFAPWNVQAGDWLQYFQDVVTALDGQFDGFALHTYTHGPDSALVTSEATMNPPFQDRRFHFRAYQDFLKRVPTTSAHLPVYITEANQNDPWAHANTGWVQAAYAEIDRWNRAAGSQKIHCLCLYRWPDSDQWKIVNNGGVIDDFKAAMSHGYQLKVETADTDITPPPPVVSGNEGAIQREWDARLTQRSVRLEESVAQSGQTLWRLVKAEYLDEQQSQGRHHILVDTLNEQGQRIDGITVEFAWASGKDFKNTEAKPGEPQAVDFPMFAAGNSYNVQVAGGASDRVLGMGLGSVEQPQMGIHVSYRLVFQRTIAKATGVLPLPQVPVAVEPVQPQAGGNWQRTLEFVLLQEGGWSDHPADPGGAKMRGISMETFTAWRQAHGQPAPSKEDLRAISDAEVEQIYREQYWIPSGASGLAWPLCLLVMDTAVLHEVGAVTTWLNEAGPNPYAFSARRLQVYTSSSSWNVFGAGWVNRVASLLKAMSPLPQVPGVVQPGPPQAGDIWQRTLAFVLLQEGGWSDHPADPGGATNMGITMGTFTAWRQAHGQPAPSKDDLRAISDAEVEQIYRERYWNPSGASGLPWPLCLLIMDTAVLHGVGAATTWFNEVGPNPYAFAAKRLRVYTNSSNWKFFGAGWVNRVASLLKAMTT